MAALLPHPFPGTAFFLGSTLSLISLPPLLITPGLQLSILGQGCPLVFVTKRGPSVGWDLYSQGWATVGPWGPLSREFQQEGTILSPKAEKPTDRMGVGKVWLVMERHLFCSFLSSPGFLDENHGHSCGPFENTVLSVLCKTAHIYNPLFPPCPVQHVMDRVGPGQFHCPLWSQGSLSLFSPQDQF